MQIETYVPPCSTTETFVLDTFTKMDQSGMSHHTTSGMSHHTTHRVAEGKESLAVSAGAASLQKAMAELAHDLFIKRAFAILGDTPLGASLFPVIVDVNCFKPAAAQQALVEDREQARLAVELRATFEADPLEDGMDHPAEQILSKALRSTEDQPVLKWLRNFSLDAAHPSFAASVLRCLGRQTYPGTGSWRAGLVRDGLTMDDVEIRDAAVQAAELWGGPDMQNVLESHSEPEPWLRNYIRDVIDDLDE